MENTKENSIIVANSNSYKQIKHFFDSNKQIQKYYTEIKEQCIKDNCYGVATMMVVTIEKLLETIEDLEDEIKFLEKQK